MSNKPAPRCPGCGNEMELTEVSKHTWRYSCDDCGWRSPTVHGPGKGGKDAAYEKAMKRYEPVQRDGYQGTAHEQGWPDQRMQTVFGGGEVRFDALPSRYPLVCQSTRETEQGYGGQWISVRDRLPDKAGSYLVCVGTSVFMANYMPAHCAYSQCVEAGFCSDLFGFVKLPNIMYWMHKPAPPKEGE